MKIFEVNGSNVITLPKQVCEGLGWQTGDELEHKIDIATGGILLTKKK
jgi:bifunctional DNA-binding transcriptional regulator/antitoxin component of YhaV-PrlF toxin-antitoxin module